jgi:RNA polymerase sigma factor (sigma-70 family)
MPGWLVVRKDATTAPRKCGLVTSRELSHLLRPLSAVSSPHPTPERAASADATRWFIDEVHPHDASLKAYLRGAFPAVRDFEDVVQESYLRIWKSRAETPIQSVKAFLFTVARRLALDFIRRGRRSPVVPVKDLEGLFVLDPKSDAREAASTAEEIQVLVEAIESLPSRCREIFVFCHLEGCTQREVAHRFGLSENTVAVQSARGLQRCEKFLRDRLKAP